MEIIKNIKIFKEETMDTILYQLEYYSYISTKEFSIEINKKTKVTKGWAMMYGEEYEMDESEILKALEIIEGNKDKIIT